MTDADEKYMDEYDQYNYEQDKLSGHHGGKGRSKKEAEQHANHQDPGGHTRKTTQKLMNNAQNQKEQMKEKK